VRSRSALGLKYLEIVEGSSEEGFQEGSVMPLSAAVPEPVEGDQILNMFDAATRRSIQQNLFEFGNAVAGRGPDINEAIGELDPVLRRLQPVARVLAADRTGLGRFFRGLEATSAELAPVAETQAALFVALDTTFTALADVARPFIQETISRTPATLETTIDTLPRIRPFLANSAGLFKELQPGVAEFAAASPVLAAAFKRGIPALRAAPKLNRQLPPTTAALLRFNDDPDNRTGLTKLTEANEELTPTLRFIAPAQFVCNYATLLARNVGSLLSLGNPLGNVQRFIVFQPPIGPNNEGSPSTVPANGPAQSNYLHVNPYPNTAAPGQKPRECEAGNEPYLVGRQVIGNVPGNQGTNTKNQGGGGE
jgi:ABC-type transporter Mla subunit MlaD